MRVDVYTNTGCSFCKLAKDLLVERGMAYHEYKLGDDFTREFILEHYPGQTSYPVIVIDGMCVGGYYGLKDYLALSEGTEDNLKFLAE